MPGYTKAVMENLILSGLREPGVNPVITNAPTPPANADFNLSLIDNEMNMAIQVFLMRTGIAPSLSEKLVKLPIVPGLDYTLPSDLITLERIEYQLSGTGAPFPIPSKSWAEFDSATNTGIDLTATGYPRAYREPYGQVGSQTIRWAPQPTYTNAGIAAGTLMLQGAPHGGDVVTAYMQNGPSNPVVTAQYIAKATDQLFDVATGLVAAINASNAVTGGSAFLQQAVSSQNALNESGLNGAIALPALLAGSGGNAITFWGVSSDVAMPITPTTQTYLAGGGPTDLLWLYYSSLGTTLVNPTDVPGIPPQFHQAIVDWCLTRFWRRKLDLTLSGEYRKDFELQVSKGISYAWEVGRAGQESMADADTSESGLYSYSETL